MKLRNSPIWRFYRGRWQHISLISSSHSDTEPVIKDPYGGISKKLSRQIEQQFSGPLGAVFGAQPTFGAGPRGQRKQSRWEDRRNSLLQGSGPLASFAQQASNFLPTIIPSAQGVGERIASQAPQIYESFRAQIAQALQQLPGLQASAAGQTGVAQNLLSEAQSPIASQALYQDALRNTFEGIRGGAAGRGLLDAGSTQAREETMGRDLASQFAERRFGEQQQALGGMQNALGAQASLLPMGAQLAGAQGDALRQLGAALASGYQLPQQALQAVYQQLAAFQDPRMALMQATAPTVTSQSNQDSWAGAFALYNTKYPVVRWENGGWVAGPYAEVA